MLKLKALGARECAHRIDSGKLSSEQLVRTRLAHAQEREDALHAWAWLASDEALSEARACDGGPRRGILHGVPIGIKDLSDTATLPTSYGSPAYAGHRPVMDSACVALARSAGAVILGKTATVEFGATRPCATTHPQNPLHTPGGSSAGSAAVVADGQVPLATGTQTGGSIIRPAAFCGVVGFKPSFASISTAGTKGYAWSLDTVGLLAQSADDAALFFDALCGATESKPLPDAIAAPHIGVFPGPFVDRAQPAALDLLERVVTACSRAGARINTTAWPAGFEHSLDWHRTVSRYELGRSLMPERRAFDVRLGQILLQEIEQGWNVGQDSYFGAKACAAKLGRQVDALLATRDVLLTLATAGEAPKGLHATGDASFNLTWSLLGLPCLSLPLGCGPGGLPLSVQLVGARQSDRKLLCIGHWIQRLFPDVMQLH